MHIDELLHKIDAKDGELRRIAEEKEQEIMIMQEGMDTTLQQLSEMKLVSDNESFWPRHTSYS